MKSDRFYLACLRDTVGTNVSFHGLSGYTSDIDKARSYSREEAQSEWNSGRSFDLPLCADKVDALGIYHVDCQYIPCDTEIATGCSRYVAFQRQRWDGNDVYWLTDTGAFTTDFLLAAISEHPDNRDNLVWLPYSVANAAKRRTFAVNKIDRRRMIQAAGLITPEHIKRYRRRKPSSKTRMNCPSCGRIHWQYNPHEFEGCTNIGCDQWRSSLEQCA